MCMCVCVYVCVQLALDLKGRTAYLPGRLGSYKLQVRTSVIQFNVGIMLVFQSVGYIGR